ncbi:EscR/YscR/HrcR family type III secretion system export apparatus protein, partial [Vibrio anguillarum]|nr:EscR/YscR/HrcR family type III secretion system export apparatus protein [Vibrio anguillarum]
AALMALKSVWPDIKPGIERIKPYFSEQSENEQMFDVFYDQSLEEEKPQNITMYYLASHMFEFFPELLERSKIKTNQLLSMIDIPLNFD